jgi:hypothetical protein
MKPLSGFLGLLLLASGAQLAQANFLISYEINNALVRCTVGTIGFIPCGPSPISSGVDLSVDAAGTPGISTSVQTLDATVSIMNTSAATETVIIWIAAQDFLPPTTPNIGFSSTLSTISTAGMGFTDLESCIDASNGLAPPPPDTFCTSPAGTLTNPVEAYSGISSATNTVASTISSPTGPYSVAEMITLELGPGSTLPVTTSLSVTPVPEPTSITLLLGGVVLLTGHAIRRKRNQEASRV